MENAANTVSGILGDLDTTIMFATAGTLNADVDDESFAGKIEINCFNFYYICKEYGLAAIIRTKKY